jgi:hypothetical protein
VSPGAPSRGHIRALVSGLPSAIRGRRILVALQAFVDEAGTDERSEVFVFSGLIASVSQWELFADEWDEVLGMSPVLRKGFHFLDALNGGGEFRGVATERRDEKLRALWHVIGKHAQFGITVVIKKSDLNFALGVMPNRDGFRPYTVGWREVFHAVAQYLVRNNIKEKVDFVFDDQKVEQDRVLRTWKSYLAECKPFVREMLFADPPIFRGDTERPFTPLQAADFLAGTHRIEWTEKPTQESANPMWQPKRHDYGKRSLQDFTPFPEVDKGLPEAVLSFSKYDLQDHFLKDLQKKGVGKIFSLFVHWSYS